MTKKYPPGLDDSIRSLLYQGVPRHEIERQTGASGGHVSDVMSEEKLLIGAGNVNAMRRLAGEVGRGKHTSLDIMRATRFLNACNARDMDDERVIECLPHIDEACNKGGIAIENLPLDIEARVEKLKSLDERIEESGKGASEADKRRQESLDRARQTDEALAGCQELRDVLASYGLSANSPEKLVNTIRNAEEAGYDAKAMIEKASTITSQDKLIAQQEDTISRHKQWLIDDKKERDKMQAWLLANEPQIKALEDFEKTGSTFSLLKAVTDTVLQVAVANRMTGYQGMEKLATDIRTRYDPFVGFEHSIAAAQKKTAEEEAKLESIKREYAHYAQTIEALKAMLSSGVSASDIMAVKYMLEKEGSSLPAFKSKAVLYGSVDNACREIDKQLKALEAKRLALEADISSREARKAALDMSIRDEEKALVKGMREAIVAVVEGSAMISNAAKQASKEMSDARAATVRDIEVIGEKADEITKCYARSNGVLTLEPLIRALNGEAVDVKEVRNSAIFAMSILLAKLPAHSPHRIGLEVLIENLKKDISFGLFS